MNLVLSKKISLEGKILLLLNFIDIIHTLLSIHLGLAVELNPVMRLLLKYGIPTFVAGKTVIVATLILVLELLRSSGKNTRLIRLSQWVAIITLPLAIALANLLLPYLGVLRRPG